MSRSALVVDDVPEIIDICSAYLRRDGFSVRCAYCGRQALEAVDVQPPDIMVLDLMLPDISGEEVCAAVRRDSDLPILMLTAKSAEADRLRGLDLGADDYLVKPFSPRELVARVRAILRRSRGHRRPFGPITVDGGWIEVDIEGQEAALDGRPLDLTRAEFRLLTTLCRQPGRVFSRYELLEAVQGGTVVDRFERTADVHVMHLRRKLDAVRSGASGCVVTVYGSGYRLDGRP